MISSLFWTISPFRGRSSSGEIGVSMMYNRKMSYEDYYNLRIIVEPFRLFDICQISDSGRAFMVTTSEKAKACKKRPVYIMGMGQAHPATNVPQATHLAGGSGARRSGEEAFTMPRITRDDIDACEIYDCFTYTVEVELMDYGFFGPGEGRDFLRAERLAPGGDFPFNTVVCSLKSISRVLRLSLRRSSS